jgi:hypothetical protein
MAERRRQRRRAAPLTAFIGPLVMLASGAATGIVLWRVLMREPVGGPLPPEREVEQLSHHDRRALEQALRERSSPQ